MWRKLILVSILCVPATAMAELRHYVASLSDSQWRVSENTPIVCRLEHDIPSYGKAIFTSEAGKQQNMTFTLDMWVKPDQVTQAKLISRAPQWRPGVVSKEITSLHYQKYFNGEVPKRAAWSMLAELSRGMEPTFYYADWYNESNKIAVGLSSANFGRKYTEFKACLAHLLPYSFEDIAFTVLNYDEGGTDLTRFSQQQLSRVQEYLAYDPLVELVLVDAYTDSYGGRSVNQKVSDTRAASVKEFFVASGIPQDRIVTFGHGERRHVASNDEMDERARNRRVVIRISKPL
ncbi:MULTISPECIES: flagellar protein MotY [Shewanella]|uniref:Flagellar protein MotY n=1 Tax=Shewanella oncorhynchi TaxID=2726434 RepID=A0AA50KAB5_9GAMM|nr:MULTISPECIES: flagellar protein MotY [Shewanella]MCU8037184.1 flagellar protein MotY [Shewanella sp. SM69]MCU8070197.1 flagellar protein MotY [Shewanella sp. SM32]WMB71489.1 flagellar protein MotY [Shewanella oncorhynchi]WVI91782.1 flagellar protein MotY [Shewanella oncorhynchi]